MKTRKRTPASSRAPQPQPAAGAIPPKPADDRSSAVVRAKPIAAVFGRTEPTKREIRERAYYIYLARGGVNGNPVSDWTQAERELRAAATGRRF